MCRARDACNLHILHQLGRDFFQLSRQAAAVEDVTIGLGPAAGIGDESAIAVIDEWMAQTASIVKRFEGRVGDFCIFRLPAVCSRPIAVETISTWPNFSAVMLATKS